MSEFEIASLDYRTATLAARHWANWIAGLALAVSAAVGAAQCAIVAWGIREMVRANRERARQTDEQARAAERRAEAQTRAADQRHAENMTALAEQGRRFDTLIEGQADQRQALNAAVASLNAQTDRLDALVEGQAEQRRASAAQTRALLEPIERTAPNAPPA